MDKDYISDISNYYKQYRAIAMADIGDCFELIQKYLFFMSVKIEKIVPEKGRKKCFKY